MIDNDTTFKAIAKYHCEIANAGDWTTWELKRKRFTRKKANAFFIGVLFDQQQYANRAWEAGDHMVDNHFQGENFWEEIHRTPLCKIEQIMRYGKGGKACFRYWRKFSKYLQYNTQLVLDKYGGDVRDLWRKVPPHEVDNIYRRFVEFKGIGTGVARMAQFILRSAGPGRCRRSCSADRGS